MPAEALNEPLRSVQQGVVATTTCTLAYTSLAFGRRLHEGRLVASMGTLGGALDSAVAESFLTTLERELPDRHPGPPGVDRVWSGGHPGLTELRRGLSEAHNQDGGPAAMNSQAGPVTTSADANPASPS